MSDIHWKYSDKANQRWSDYLMDLATKYPNATIILGGDNGSNDPSHEIALFEKVRKVFPNSDIRFVFGNHSYWMNEESPKYKMLGNSQFLLNGAEGITSYIKEIAKKLNILYLPENPIIGDGYTISGFSGWYEKMPQGMNDPYRIPDFYMSNQWLSKKNYEEFCEALSFTGQNTDQYNIVVSHFPVHGEVEDWKGGAEKGEPSWFGGHRDYAQHFDFVNEFWYGHTHHCHNSIIDNVKVVNCGADYGKPNHYEFDEEKYTK